MAPVATPEGLAALGGQQPEPAVRAKGIEEADDDGRALTYVGPAEDGSVEVKRSGAASADSNGGGSRRERREAKRQASRGRKILRRG